MAAETTQRLAYDAPGFCPVCEKTVQFRARYSWFRGQLRCSECNSNPRERAFAVVLNKELPNWRDLAIHESSPGPAGVSRKLKLECPNYIGTQFFGDQPFGATVKGWRNENLEKQTFEDDRFDLVVSLDVMEHVFHPDRAYKEIYRTLKPGGLYIHTFPIYKAQTEALIRKASIDDEGNIEFLSKPEYHGNPVSADGALVTFEYGYDITKNIAEWAPFSVFVVRFCDPFRAILGEMTEVIVCAKYPAPVQNP
jgi:SAM-dependent methyltransferase